VAVVPSVEGVEKSGKSFTFDADDAPYPEIAVQQQFVATRLGHLLHNPFGTSPRINWTLFAAVIKSAQIIHQHVGRCDCLTGERMGGAIAR
jgi:hypothetical protein